jgi:hypothetical protein
MSVSYAYAGQPAQLASSDAVMPQGPTSATLPGVLQVQGQLLGAIENALMRLPSMQALQRLSRSS